MSHAPNHRFRGRCPIQVPACLLYKGETIQSVLVVAEKREFAPCINRLLREHGCDVTIVESYGRVSDVVHDMSLGKFDLVIATNTSLPAAHIQSIIPDIKARHPHARIIVLSGYCPDDFVADLKHKGIDGFLPLPFEESALLKEVTGLLSRPPPDSKIARREN